MGNFLNAVEGTNVVEGVDGGTQTAVKAENLVLNKSGEGEVVEEVGEVFPDIGIAVFAQALVVKTVDLCNLAGFVISSENGDTLGVTDLKTDKESDGLHRVVTTVDVVTCQDQYTAPYKSREIYKYP